MQQQILLADDDTLVRTATATFLRKKGYRILEANDGQMALELLHIHHPALLITDLRMPRLDGIELLKIVLREFSEIPAIILSGMGTMDDVIEAIRLGAFDYLSKPLQDMRQVEDCLVKALKHAQKRQKEKSDKEQIAFLTQKIQEQETREALILHAKKELERTIDSMSEMVAIIDSEQKILRINSPLQKKIGIPYSEILGTTCNTCFPNCKNGEGHCPHKDTIADGLMHRVEFFEEKWDCYLELTTVPYTDTNGSVIGSVHISRDISGQRKAEKDKEKLQSQLLHAQKMESVGQLAAGIAHEINTPTQFIATNIDFMDEAATDITTFMKEIQQIANDAPQEIGNRIRSAMEDADWEYLSEELPRAISQSLDGVKRVSSIVRAMKEFSHPGSREKVSQNLNRIIETTTIIARNEWKYLAELELKLDPELPLIPLLADEMGQVILNLLDNGAQAISDKLGDNSEGKKGSISITTSKVNNTVELRIRDSGMGIPENARSRIFDPFFTTKEVGKGTGQGLAISHGVITEKHGGNIRFRTELGKGTEFIINLPINAEEKDSTKDQQEA